jgi:hypothetical protein
VKWWRLQQIAVTLQEGTSHKLFSATWLLRLCTQSPSPLFTLLYSKQLLGNCCEKHNSSVARNLQNPILLLHVAQPIIFTRWPQKGEASSQYDPCTFSEGHMGSTWDVWRYERSQKDVSLEDVAYTIWSMALNEWCPVFSTETISECYYHIYSRGHLVQMCQYRITPFIPEQVPPLQESKGGIFFNGLLWSPIWEQISLKGSHKENWYPFDVTLEPCHHSRDADWMLPPPSPAKIHQEGRISSLLNVHQLFACTEQSLQRELSNGVHFLLARLAHRHNTAHKQDPVSLTNSTAKTEAFKVLKAPTRCGCPKHQSKRLSGFYCISPTLRK